MTREDPYDPFKRTLIGWICVLMMQCYFGQEYECEVEFTGECISKVRWKIPEKYAQRKTPFTVFYRSSNEKTENAVLLHYVGHYYCEADVGHVCDDADNSTSIIRNSAATCVADRVYILAADGEDGVICVHTIQTQSTGSHPDTHKQNDTNCSNDTFHKESFIGVTAGIVCMIIIILLLTFIAVVWFQIRRGRLIFTKQRKAHPTNLEEEEVKEGTSILDEQMA